MDPTELDEKISRFRGLLAESRIAMITTAASDGSLHSRPVETLEFDVYGQAWFFLRRASSQADDVRANGRVSLSYASPSRSVSVTGRGEIIVDHEKARALWRDELAPAFNAPDDDEIALLKVNVEKVEYWTSPGSALAELVEFFGGPPTPIRSSVAVAAPESAHH